jgi:ubiquinone/menaquinone biosynthesis C-methylase UbiE
MDDSDDKPALQRDYRRFDEFLSRLAKEVYPEQPSQLHTSLTRNMVQDLHASGQLRPGMRVLDVGCGQGIALEQFQALGLDAVGITLGEDVAVCRAKGYAVLEMDQSFMTFGENEFDVLWARHVLEHSVVPLFTLSEYWRVLKPGGLLYVEVPAPETSARHETNPNHYSMLPLSPWLQLFTRSGFEIERQMVTNFTVQCGPDTYWSFHLRKR